MEEEKKELSEEEVSPQAAETAEPWEATLLAEAELLKEAYPDFELETQMQDPLFRGLLRGEIHPGLKQVYELCHGGEIMKQRVETAVSETLAKAVDHAVAEAVAKTVIETEERMLSRIRARGQRPAESGLNAALGVRAHPAVDRLTKADREKLARRASRGETIRL